MTVIVRQVNLETEREQLLAILQHNLPDLPHRDRFPWLYLNNPAGPALSWFAYEVRTAQVIGTTSVFRRVLWIGETQYLCGQVGDFAVATSHRSLGPALMLQRATFEPVTQGVFAFCYDCPPHERGMSTFRRLGFEASCYIQRYARLLRVDRHVARRFGASKGMMALAYAGNGLLSLTARRKARVSGLDIMRHTASFGEEFSRLDQQVGGKVGVIRSRREAEDLQWRYKEDPVHQYQVLTARRGGELVAFVVFSIVEHDAYIIDLFGLEDGTGQAALLDAVVDSARQAAVQTLHAFVAESDALTSLLPQARLRYREASTRVVVYAQPGTAVQACLAKNPHWFFKHADILA